MSARRDVESIRAYIAQFNPSAAHGMAGKLVAIAESLTNAPERGRAIGKGRRENTVVYPYIIRYRITDEAVYILRVRHGARRPLH